MQKGWGGLYYTHPCSKRWVPQGAGTVLCSRQPQLPTMVFLGELPALSAVPGPAGVAATTRSQKLSSPQGIRPLLANRNHGFCLKGRGKLLLTAPRPCFPDHFGLSCCSSCILAVGRAERSLRAGCALLAPLHARVSREPPGQRPTHGSVSAAARARRAEPSAARARSPRRRG